MINLKLSEAEVGAFLAQISAKTKITRHDPEAWASFVAKMKNAAGESALSTEAKANLVWNSIKDYAR